MRTCLLWNRCALTQPTAHCSRFGWWKKNLLVRNPCQKCEKFYATLSKISEGWMKPGVALSGLRQRQPPLLSFGYKKDPKFSVKPSVQLQNCPEEVFQTWSLLSHKERGNRFIKVFFYKSALCQSHFCSKFLKKNNFT